MKLSSSRKAVVVIAALAMVKIGLHLWANTTGFYEFHRDEFLYFAMGEHLFRRCRKCGRRLRADIDPPLMPVCLKPSSDVDLARPLL